MIYKQCLLNTTPAKNIQIIANYILCVSVDKNSILEIWKLSEIK